MSTPRSSTAPGRAQGSTSVTGKPQVPPARSQTENKTSRQSYSERLVARRLTKEPARARAAGR